MKSMAPIIKTEDKKATKILDAAGISYKLINSNKFNNQSDYIHVPSLNLDISKQKYGFGKNWNEAHEVAKNEGGRMLTLPEFREFLNYT